MSRIIKLNSRHSKAASVWMQVQVMVILLYSTGELAFRFLIDVETTRCGVFNACSVELS